MRSRALAPKAAIFPHKAHDRPCNHYTTRLTGFNPRAVQAKTEEPQVYMYLNNIPKEFNMGVRRIRDRFCPLGIKRPMKNNKYTVILGGLKALNPEQSRRDLRFVGF